ncbi:HYC_CC_PP family protein [Capnocytophaga canimorsus]|uniref:HYC_CC_PP family protein n=1 Tax=Capnocytophaga canimorsus TaxID=28188 RepID=UPI0037CD3BBB
MITKLGHILFSLLLIFSNSGLAFSLHYCKERLASVSVTVEPVTTDKESKSCCLSDEESILYCDDKSKEPKSCCLSDEESIPCCDDKSIEAPQTDDEFLSKILKINESTFILPCEVAHIFVKTASAERKLSNSYTQNTQSNSPPLYQLYCRLVFYA